MSPQSLDVSPHLLDAFWNEVLSAKEGKVGIAIIERGRRFPGNDAETSRRQLLGLVGIVRVLLPESSPVPWLLRKRSQVTGTRNSKAPFWQISSLSRRTCKIENKRRALVACRSSLESCSWEPMEPRKNVGRSLSGPGSFFRLHRQQPSKMPGTTLGHSTSRRNTRTNS